MAIADLLSSLLPALAGQSGLAGLPIGSIPNSLPPEGSSPGFAGGHFGGYGRGPTEEWKPPQMGVDLDAAMTRNTQLGQQQRMQRPLGTPSKFLNTLGMIGDALAMWRGGQPLYSMRLKEQQAQARQQGINDALKNYLTDPDAAIAAVMEIDAPTGIQLAQSRQGKTPEEIALMRMVGIDPTSDEGKEIIKSRLMGRGQSDPTFVRELEALGIDPASDEARDLFYGRNSPAGYLLKPRGRSQAPALSPGKVVNGYRFKGGNPNDRNSWEAVGGPTPSASGPFPSPGY